MDDGSTQTDAIEYLKQLETKFAKHNWKIIRQKNKYLGAARNEALRHAAGDYIIFMDDDNYATPSMIETLVNCILNSGADVVTTLSYFHYSPFPPDAKEPGNVEGFPIGAAYFSGAFENSFGDANAIFKKSVVIESKGFFEYFGVPLEDWEFYSRLLSLGKKIYICPLPTFWYRVRLGSMLRSTPFAIPLHKICENYSRTKITIIY